MKATIYYLDTPKTVEVEVPLDGLRVGYGDRRSTADASGPLPVYTADFELTAKLELRQRGADGAHYFVEPGHPMRAELLRVRDLVSAAADEAERTDPEIAEAVGRYAVIIRKIDAAHTAHRLSWEQDAKSIAKLFGRGSVQLGEETVPGKVCVRSSRGTLLGYADCWDGRWLGTVETRR